MELASQKQLKCQDKAMNLINLVNRRQISPKWSNIQLISWLHAMVAKHYPQCLLQPGDKVSRPKGPSIESRMAEYQGSKGRERGLDFWGGQPAPFPPAMGSRGAL